MGHELILDVLNRLVPRYSRSYSNSKPANTILGLASAD